MLKNDALSRKFKKKIRFTCDKKSALQIKKLCPFGYAACRMIHSRKTGTDVIFIFKDHADG